MGWVVTAVLNTFYVRPLLHRAGFRAHLIVTLASWDWIGQYFIAQATSDWLHLNSFHLGIIELAQLPLVVALTSSG
jgi:hypothetical protein